MKFITITNPSYADYLIRQGRYDLLGEVPMSMVNRVVINPPALPMLRFRDISMGQMFRAVNRQRDCNVYMKMCTNLEHKAIALWSGDICSPADGMEIELVPSVTIERA